MDFWEIIYIFRDEMILKNKYVSGGNGIMHGVWGKNDRVVGTNISWSQESKYQHRLTFRRGFQGIRTTSCIKLSY